MNDTMRRPALVLTIALASTLAPVYAQQPANPPLKNWAAPLYWHPTEAERQTAGRALPELKFSTNQISADALTFVAITPCRLVDTRGAAAGFIGVTPFNGPGVPAGGGNLTFPVQSSAQTSTTAPAPCGAIPTTAAAYSINLTVVPVAGGAVDNVSLWPSGSTQPFVATLNDPQGIIAQNSAIVPAGTPFGGFSFHSTGPAATDIVIDMNGYYAAPSDLNGNTAIGVGTLASNTTGTNNTAVGSDALQTNTTGIHNTAVGTGALQETTTGSANTAVGNNALQANTTGSGNTAVGGLSLSSNTTGGGNTAIGQQSLLDNTTGNNNTASGQFALNVNTIGSNNTATGQNALLNNTTGNNNTATGQFAMNSNTTGCCNTASGQDALGNNTTGNANAAFGGSALQNNTGGGSNAAFGQGALFNNTTACCNTAIGQNAMNANTTGTNNVALGQNALQSNTTLSGNTAVGAGALHAAVGTQDTAVGTGALGSSTSPFNSVAIGWGAANGVSGGNNNIHIGNTGSSGDNNVVKIGTLGTQTSFFVAGVSGIGTGLGSPVPVLIDANGQLGTMSSSRRFKEDIQDMGDASSGLMSLRPVTFRYKQPYTDGSKPIDYGLIAEEVADVYPDLVAYSPSGEVQTVQYQKVNAMLLNEVQKQHQQMQEQSGHIQAQQEEMSALKARLAELAEQLEKLTAPK